MIGLKKLLRVADSLADAKQWPQVASDAWRTAKTELHDFIAANSRGFTGFTITTAPQENECDLPRFDVEVPTAACVQVDSQLVHVFGGSVSYWLYPTDASKGLLVKQVEAMIEKHHKLLRAFGRVETLHENREIIAEATAKKEQG